LQYSRPPDRVRETLLWVTRTRYERRFPLNSSKFTIGTLAVVMLVVLRITIGWHFFYEGVWKIANADKFSTTPFLVQAKGPAAELFYAMVYDIDGRQRLAAEKDEEGNTVRGRIYTDAWKALVEKVEVKYKLSEEQLAEAQELYDRYEASVEDYLEENAEDIEAYFGSLERFEPSKNEGNFGAPFQKKRRWNRQQELRAEVNGWLAELDGMQEDFHKALWNVLDEDQKAKGPLPVAWEREDLMNVMMTYGLTAIGFCMMVGLCTRLASLGGAVFLINVLLTQPPWPTIYPPAPAVVGHALIVDKNFVEMVAMVTLATLPVGRWGGLDYFLHHWFGRPLLAWLGRPID